MVFSARPPPVSSPVGAIALGAPDPARRHQEMPFLGAIPALLCGSRSAAELCESWLPKQIPSLGTLVPHVANPLSVKQVLRSHVFGK